jgi:hypothetical protein
MRAAGLVNGVSAEEFEMTRRQTVSPKTWHVLGIAFTLAATTLLSGCPEELPPRSVYRRVAADPVEATVDRNDQTKAMHKRAKEVRARLRVETMRMAFLTDAERECTEDSQCTLTPLHCCNCTGNGELTAVNANLLGQVLSRRAGICADYSCAQAMSSHPSCSARTAVCREGKCVPNPADVAAAPPPAGVGVETIKDEAPTK